MELKSNVKNSIRMNIDEINELKKNNLQDAADLLELLEVERKKHILNLNSKLKYEVPIKSFDCSKFNRSYILNKNKLWLKQSHNLNCAIERISKNEEGKIVHHKGDLILEKPKKKFVNHRLIILNEIKQNLKKIEKNMKTKMKINKIQTELEKIEVRHMEGKLKETDFSEFNGEKILISPPKKENYIKQVIKNKKSKLIKDKANRNKSINQIDDNVENSLNKQSSFLSGMLNISNIENQKDKIGFPDHSIISSSKSSSSTNSSDVREMAKLNDSELEILNEFIREDQIDKNKEMKFFMDNLIQVDGKQNKKKQNLNTFDFNEASGFKKKDFSKLNFDYITKTKLVYINSTADKLNRIMKIVYPDLMSKKQIVINKKLDNMRQTNKKKFGKSLNFDSSKPELINLPKFNNKTIDLLSTFSINSKSVSTETIKNLSYQNNKGLNNLNEKFFNIDAMSQIKKPEEFLRKINYAESYINQAKKYDEVIYNSKYARNSSLASKIRNKLIN